MNRHRFILAFTLLELLVTIAIVGILTALLSPAIKTGIERSRSAQCIGNLKQLSAGIMGYAADHQMEMPIDRITNSDTGLSWFRAIENYVPRGAPFATKRAPYFCPANNAPHDRGSGGWTNYAINSNLYHDRFTPLRLSQVLWAKALLIDSFGSESPGTYYLQSGARYSAPWPATEGLHGGRLNVAFIDGHVESPKVEPRKIHSGTKDLNELRAEWFWPVL